MSHTLTMSSAQNGYKLGGTYIGTKQISPTEAFPVILGDVDPAGNVNFSLIHQLTPKIRLKGAAQVICSLIILNFRCTRYSVTTRSNA